MTHALPTGQASRCTVRDVCAMLGVPRADWNSFRRWAVALRSHGREPGRAHAVHPALDAMHAYVDVMIAERCAHRTDDLLSELIGAEIDGIGFTADELRLAVVTLVTMASSYESASPRG